MGALTPKRTEKVLKRFLASTRTYLNDRKINSHRVPRWVLATKVRYGFVHETVVAVFEDSLGNDTFQCRGSVSADTVVLYDVPNFQCSGVTLPIISHDSDMTIWKGRAENHNIFTQLGVHPALFSFGFRGSHEPFAAFNLFLMHVPDYAENMSDGSARFVPLVLYIHKSDLEESDQFITMSSEKLGSYLAEVAGSPEGEYYEYRYWRYSSCALDKKSGVIIFGKDSETELDEMIKTREYMRVRGYNADLIRHLAEFPMMSNEEKVRLWAASSRFCIMIDRVASGHVKEYEILKQQRTILAVLRQKGKGSTFMIGDDTVDINFIKIFEFEVSPIECLEKVMQWAQSVIDSRIAF